MYERHHNGGRTLAESSGEGVALSAGADSGRTLLERPGASSHIVQFYEDDAFLCDSVAHFIAVGLAAGEPVLVIATAEHREALQSRLARDHVSLDEAALHGQLVWLDARQTLAKFMVRDMPDWSLFNDLLGALLERTKGCFPGVFVRAYGEMVDVLWREGNKQAALRLEGMWNDLAGLHSFSLLCAYVMGNFYRSGDPESFRDVCRAHTHVLREDSGDAPGDAEKEKDDTRGDLTAGRREIDQLQQRAGALENELAHRKELELALREALIREKAAREEAERSVRYNEMFAGMLGHDLRNPLSAITTGANYIARLNSSQKSAKAATRILGSAERMGRMIDQLLDFTRIRVGGGLPLAPAHLDLEEICCKVKDELEAANPERNILVEAQGNLGGAWDHDRLHQVFSNLVANALHHGTEGCPIVIRCDGEDADHVDVSVHNDGEVAAEVLPILFEPFRGNTRYQRTRGLGLGLFITQQIVVAHGGAIEVASREGAGTTFRIRLPRVPRSPVAPSGPAAFH